MRSLLTSLRYPLKTITFLLWRMSRRKAHAQTKIHNLQRPSYALDVAAVLGDCVVPIRPLEVDNAQVWLGLSEHFRAHRFDVLGSGWTHIASPSQHLEARINISNITESKKIALLMTPDYQMIDWQLEDEA